MVVKSRLTVLFEEAEDVGKHLQSDDHSLTVKGGPNILVQKRWIWGNAESQDEDNKRITWSAGKVSNSTLAEVINCVLSPGFNVYTAPGEPLEKGVDAAVFNSYHDDTFQIDKFLPPDSEARNLVWGSEYCDLDIRLRNNYTEVTQWCPLSGNSTVKFEKEEGVDSHQAGLFYLDTQDDNLINLSGITCKTNSNGSIEKCQKTSLFYKAAHISAQNPGNSVVELEVPTGLHPKLLVNLTNVEQKDKCEYYAYLQLPVGLFVDKYQSSPLFVLGEHDLELPEYKLRDNIWGSESLFYLNPGEVNEITLHSRYAEPVLGSDPSKIAFTPMVLQACDGGDTEVERNPFYSKGAGYEAFFTGDTVFTHFNSKTLEVSIPKPDVAHYNTTKYATLACLLLATVYLIVKVFRQPIPKRSSTR